MRALSAGLVYFAIVFAIGFVLGTIRTVWLTPHIGVFGAVLIELPVILAASWWACGWVIRRISLPTDLAPRAVMGASAFIFLILAEYGLAAGFQNLSFGAFLNGLATLAGAVGLSGQILFAIFPLIWREQPSI